MANTLQTIELDDTDVFEEFWARGWTDGLPVVAPTPARVEALLGYVADDELRKYAATVADEVSNLLTTA